MKKNLHKVFVKLSFGDDDPGDPAPGEKDKDPAPGDQDPKDGEPAPGDEGEPNDGESIDDLPPWAQKQIKSLRKENASHRTKSKDLETRFSKLESGLKTALGLEEDDVDPEDKIKELTQSSGQLEFQNAILEVAVEHEIPKAKLDYFQFLMSKACEGLEDDEELSDEDLLKLVQKAKAVGQGPADSSVDDEDGKSPKGTKKDNGDTVDLDAFVAMNVIERSNLFNKNRDLYSKLFKEANSKNLI